MGVRKDLNKAYDLKVIKKQEERIKTIAILAFGEIIQTTPVDTGRAKQNWFLDINNIELKIVEPTPASKTRDGVLEASGEVARYKITDTVYISNNLPYIQRLNDGYSAQAPALFVEGAIQVAVEKAKELS